MDVWCAEFARQGNKAHFFKLPLYPDNRTRYFDHYVTDFIYARQRKDRITFAVTQIHIYPILYLIAPKVSQIFSGNVRNDVTVRPRVSRAGYILLRLDCHHADLASKALAWTQVS